MLKASWGIATINQPKGSTAVTTTQTNIPSSSSQGAHGIGTCVAFDQINEPGAYVCNWSGHLLRVPPDSIKPGRSPLICIKSTDTLFVTKLCNDPFIPVSKARMLAADCDVCVNF